jgi:hypothetical protein
MNITIAGYIKIKKAKKFKLVIGSRYSNFRDLEKIEGIDEKYMSINLGDGDILMNESFLKKANNKVSILIYDKSNYELCGFALIINPKKCVNIVNYIIDRW